MEITAEGIGRNAIGAAPQGEGRPVRPQPPGRSLAPPDGRKATDTLAPVARPRGQDLGAATARWRCVRAYRLLRR